MTAAATLARARADGVTLALDPAGKLKVRGTDAAVARWLPEVRAHKPALLAILSGTGPAPAGEPADPATNWRWLISPADGCRFSLSSTPPATRAEVEALHPGALVDLEPSPAPVAPHHLEQAAAILEPVPTPTPALVTCRTCGHWRRDQVGDGSGLGRCLASAPASFKPGSCWPRGEIVCREHQGVTE
ncbi:hypothetical protein [uncultured Thiodictyon sp.]|uniref:hypothetical protein n=1 Tax=uncultured Thiodictyon sp. TaxID=1846217 RepID=UPI0025E0A9E6|nr:hypothetical protein [uncultured Thiodictyon sp.]